MPMPSHNGAARAANTGGGEKRAGGAARQGPRHGTVRTGIWHKVARGSLHMLRTPKAWAVDVADLAAAEAVGVRLVEVHDLESLRKYYATPATIRDKGFPLNRGHGEQVALSLEHWKGTPQEGMAPEQAPTTKPTGPVQLALLGGGL